MAEITTLPLHRPVNWPVVLLEESRLLINRYLWLIVIYLLVFILAALRTLIVSSVIRVAPAGMYLDLSHIQIWPVFLHPYKLLALISVALWGMSIWCDSGPHQRASFWAMPISRKTHHSARIVTGALILLIIHTFAWYIGIGVSAVFMEVRGLIAGIFPPPYFMSQGIALLSIYLLAVLTALRLNSPYRWLFLYFPAFILIIFGLQLLFNSQILNSILSPLTSSYGLLGGLGIVLWDSQGNTMTPVTWVPFAWFMIISAGTWFAVSRYQEE